MRIVKASKKESIRGHNSAAGKTGAGMYAIVFDLDMESLQELYHNDSYKNAYANIRNFLEKRGFDHMQGSTYFGDDTIDAVSCVLTVQDLTAEFDWFAGSVRDIRMLKIEENNDLSPVIDRAVA